MPLYIPPLDRARLRGVMVMRTMLHGCTSPLLLFFFRISLENPGNVGKLGLVLLFNAGMNAGTICVVG